ncbi:MAG: hypothetical protein JWQ98_2239 [Chlorobi bacterium]|nr:hypothetical protein [Chlorobiota bacterium]
MRTIHYLMLATGIVAAVAVAAPIMPPPLPDPAAAISPPLPSPPPACVLLDDVFQRPTRQHPEQRQFQLSVDYPTTPPPTVSYPWSDPNHWREYMFAVLRYAYQDNLSNEWYKPASSAATWFHAPWMGHKYSSLNRSGFGGREWAHGLTKEHKTPLRDLSPTMSNSKGQVDNWAVSIYNAPGGYTLRKVWEKICADNANQQAIIFPPGTVVVKLIFTQATSNLVPYLANDVEWKANIDEQHPDNLLPLRLIQIDIAVRDTRADATTGWVFGTFMFDGRRPIDSLWQIDTQKIPKDLRPWFHVYPLGLTWGVDPGRTNNPVELHYDPKLAATIRSPLGLQGRLNGPIDNPRSSCIACHAQAERVSGPKAKPPTERNGFERNLKPGEALTPGLISLDFSLQLKSGIYSYWNKQNANAMSPHINNVAVRQNISGPPAGLRQFPSRPRAVQRGHTRVEGSHGAPSRPRAVQRVMGIPPQPQLFNLPVR